MPKLSILSFSLEYENPYAAGHVCTRAEAEVLSATLTRGLAKGLHRVILAAGARPREDVQRAAERYVAEHLAGFAHGHERLRAIEAEARKIAQGMVETALYKAGLTAKSIGAGDFQARVGELSSRGDVLREAERRVDDIQRIAREAHEELLVARGGEDA